MNHFIISVLVSALYVTSSFGWSKVMKVPFRDKDVVTIALFSFGGALTALALGTP